MFLAEYLAFCGKRAKTSIHPKEASEEVAEIAESEFLVLPSVILDSRTETSRSNSYFQTKTEDMEFKLEDLHHSIDGKEETSKPDTECKFKKNAKGLFTCESCDYQSVSRSIFIRHLRTHTDEKSFICRICDSKFAVKSTLRQHLKSHAPKENSRKHLKISPIFACKFCDKQFAHKDGLKVHLRTHTVEKRCN